MQPADEASAWFKAFVAVLFLLLLVAVFTVGLLAYTAFNLGVHFPNLPSSILCIVISVVILFALYHCKTTRLTRLIAGLVLIAFSVLLYLAMSFTTDPSALADSANALVADLPKYLDALRNAVAISFAALGGNIAAHAILESPQNASAGDRNAPAEVR